MQPEEQPSNSIYPEPATHSMPLPQADASTAFTPPVGPQVVAPAFTQHTPAKSASSTYFGATDQTDLSALANAQPIAVVKTLSVRGVEYLFMSLTLWFAATGLIWVLLLLVNGQTSAPLLGFPATALIVCIPIFSYFFLRLKKAELADPALRFDSSKRRLSQITQTIAFLTCLFNVISFVYLMFAKVSGVGLGTSVIKLILDLVVILAVAGGILAYYWADEHRSFNR